jgi:hypothetical protein
MVRREALLPISAFGHLEKLNPSKLGLEENETAEIIADRIHRCRIVWITSANSGYSVSNQNPVGRDSEGQNRRQIDDGSLCTDWPR